MTQELLADLRVFALRAAQDTNFYSGLSNPGVIELLDQADTIYQWLVKAPTEPA